MMNRPGISLEALERAGVRPISKEEAQRLCGLAEPGLWLPYRTLAGAPINDGEKVYGRLRLEKPVNSKKYHQEFGTGVHAYLPPGLEAVASGGDLIVIEGEFKALSLMEAGFPAVGISGFFGFALKGGETLAPELHDVIERLKPARILFCGDSDTALNYQFPVAAVRFAKLVHPLPVVLPRIPLSGPGKGADDCREAYRGGFPEWWRDRVNTAHALTVDTMPELLALDLFAQEQNAIPILSGTARYQAEQRVIKLAAALENHPLLKERVLAFAEKKLKINRRTLNQAVKSAVDRARHTEGPASVEAFYDPAHKCYWITNDRNEMIEINENSMRMHLMKMGVSSGAEKGELSEVDSWLVKIQTRQDVLYAGPLAGHAVGVKEMCGQRILITRAANLPKSVIGDCPMIEKLLIGLLDDPTHDQIAYLLGWLKIGYEALFEGKLRHGQALAIAGPRDCGKSIIQAIITEVLGGRAAKPYRYMCGATEFNGDLFAAEHLMIEDEVAFTDIRARRHFGARIKDFTVNTVQSCHGKNRQALSLKPFWRVTITLNDEPENLLILPPIDESLEDKIILLKAYKNPMPMETGTLAGRNKFMAVLMEEIPMFIHQLQRFEIPERLRSERFGIKHFQHPELLSALSDMSPEMRLLSLIDAMMDEVNDPGAWEGSATELEQVLFQSKFSHEARRLLDWNNATGTYLGRLAKQTPFRVRQERSNTERRWIISPKHWNTNPTQPNAPAA